LELNERQAIQTTQGKDLAVAASAAQAKAEIEAAYVMAERHPRNWEDVRARILDACKRPVFADGAEYKLPFGKDDQGRSKNITGPSIRFAEVAIQAAQHVRISSCTIYEDDFQRKIRTTVTDMEANISYSKESVLDKTVERHAIKTGQTTIGQRVNSSGQIVYIIAATEADMLKKQGAEESKAIRTCGLRLIPEDIKEEAMRVARETVLSKIGDPKETLHKIEDALRAYSVMPSDIAQYLGKPVEQLTKADAVELIAIHTAIRDGQAKWQDYMDAKEEDGEKKPPIRPANAKQQGDLKSKLGGTDGSPSGQV